MAQARVSSWDHKSTKRWNDVTGHIIEGEPRECPGEVSRGRCTVCGARAPALPRTVRVESIHCDRGYSGRDHMLPECEYAGEQYAEEHGAVTPLRVAGQVRAAAKRLGRLHVHRVTIRTTAGVLISA